MKRGRPVAGATGRSRTRKPSNLENEIAKWLDDNGYPGYVREYPLKSPVGFFHGKRRTYHIDMAWPELKIALEVDGGTLSRRRTGHVSPKGYASDRYKDVVLQVEGWVFFRVTQIHVRERMLGQVMQFLFSLRENDDATTDRNTDSPDVGVRSV